MIDTISPEGSLMLGSISTPLTLGYAPPDSLLSIPLRVEAFRIYSSTIYKRFALSYGAYALVVFVLRAAFGSNPFESLDAFIIFGLTFYLVKTFTDQNNRALSDREQREIIGALGVTVFVVRILILLPQVKDTGTAIIASLFTSFMQILVVALAVISVRMYSSFKRS